jgi:hypothetical protein
VGYLQAVVVLGAAPLSLGDPGSVPIVEQTLDPAPERRATQRAVASGLAL